MMLRIVTREVMGGCGSAEGVGRSSRSVREVRGGMGGRRVARGCRVVERKVVVVGSVYWVSAGLRTVVVKDSVAKVSSAKDWVAGWAVVGAGCGSSDV